MLAAAAPVSRRARTPDPSRSCAWLAGSRAARWRPTSTHRGQGRVGSGGVAEGGSVAGPGSSSSPSLVPRKTPATSATRSVRPTAILRSSATAETAPRYRVTGALVFLKTQAPYGARLVSFKKNALVAADVPQDQIDHHLRVKLIASIDAPDEPAANSRKATSGG
jgi:hypothetical protein